MKIYTKGGDKGKTSLIGGERVFKNDIQVDAYGTIDELISYIGLIRSHEQINEIFFRHPISIPLFNFLVKIQGKLMTCASIVSKQKDYNINLPEIKDDDIDILEKLIDHMTSNLPKLESFILPGGNIISSHCHVARTICRRAERLVINVTIEKNLDNDIVIKYINRLSDFLFTLSRFLNDHDKETKWVY